MAIRVSRRTFGLGAVAVASTAMMRAAIARAAAPVVENVPEPVSDPSSYLAYVPTACKTGPFFTYTCEFDAAWAVLKTFGIEASLDEQLAAIRIDHRLEPSIEYTDRGALIYGGDITRSYSGDYTSSFLARTTCAGMRPVFRHFGLRTTHVSTRERIEDHLRVGRLIWIKSTVDFKDWTPATWITPEGERLDVVLSNDHAFVVIGYNEQVAVIRDVLGPTDTNWSRPYEFEVPWERFLECFAAQGNDGLSVGLYDDSKVPVGANGGQD